MPIPALPETRRPSTSPTGHLQSRPEPIQEQIPTPTSLRDLRVVELRVRVDRRRERVFPPDEPDMPSVKVGLIHRRIRPLRDRGRIGPDRPPEVGEVAIKVVHRLDARIMWTPKKDREGNQQRLDVVPHVSEAIPHDGRNAGLTAEPGNGAFIGKAALRPSPQQDQATPRLAECAPISPRTSPRVGPRMSDPRALLDDAHGMRRDRAA